jgi:hypothetical protein
MVLEKIFLLLWNNSIYMMIKYCDKLDYKYHAIFALYIVNLFASKTGLSCTGLYHFYKDFTT